MIDADGIWVERPRRAAIPPGRPALFLDRDGVIVEDHGFLTEPGDVRMIGGAARLIADANRRGVAVVVVTNQSGIGRGLFDWNAFVRVEARIRAELADASAELDAVLACPHHPQALPPYRRAHSPDRKPNPGMLLKAAALLDLSLGTSWIIGDRHTDLLAGKSAGLAGGLHVATGEGGLAAERAAALALDDRHFRVAGIASIAGAAPWLPWFGGGADPAGLSFGHS